MLAPEHCRTEQPREPGCPAKQRRLGWADPRGVFNELTHWKPLQASRLAAALGRNWNQGRGRHEGVIVPISIGTQIDDAVDEVQVVPGWNRDGEIKDAAGLVDGPGFARS